MLWLCSCNYLTSQDLPEVVSNMPAIDVSDGLSSTTGVSIAVTQEGSISNLNANITTVSNMIWCFLALWLCSCHYLASQDLPEVVSNMPVIYVSDDLSSTTGVSIAVAQEDYISNPNANITTVSNMVALIWTLCSCHYLRSKVHWQHRQCFRKR